MKKSQLLLTLLLGLVSSCDSPVGCVDTNCSDYATHEQAQAAYEADPDCHGDLDRDHDGIACESLPRESGKAPNPLPITDPDQEQPPQEADSSFQWWKEAVAIAKELLK